MTRTTVEDVERPLQGDQPGSADRIDGYSRQPMTPDEPLARALDALQYLYTPEMDPVTLAAWQEVRDAILKAQAQHRAAIAALEELAPEEGEARALAVPGGQAEGELLQELELHPDQPLFCGMIERA